MKKALSIALYAISMLGCISTSHIAQTSGLSELKLKSIPDGAKEVIIIKNIPADDLYEEIMYTLITRGHRISKGDKEMKYVVTEGKDVGQSTLQRLTAFVTEKEGVSTAVIKSEWKAGTEASMGASMFAGFGISVDWAKAEWKTGRPGIAFAESVAIANEIKDSEVTFK
ncbi:MAG TPA: hypothetical protein DDW85_11690 [Porphyromonadaceae bacterium]|jgi:hypothetical protein|nr:hypothetical protein [Porphyromonadaceae bacterium]